MSGRQVGHWYFPVRGEFGESVGSGAVGTKRFIDEAARDREPKTRPGA